MQGTITIRRGVAHGALVCLALLIVAACSDVPYPDIPSPLPTIKIPEPERVWTDLGPHAVTMRAAASCYLPDYAVAPSWEGRLKQSDQDLVVEFDDPHFVGFSDSGFAGTMDGDTVRFTLNADYFSPYSFVYLIAPGTEIGYVGTASGTRGDSGILATFDGAVVLYNHDNGEEIVRCDAPDHQIELVRK